MDTLIVTALLLIALVLPVVLFWSLRTRTRLHGLLAAALAVAMGWALNLAWAFASQSTAADATSAADGDTVAIALRFGWACPAVLIFIAWLVWRRKSRPAA